MKCTQNYAGPLEGVSASQDCSFQLGRQDALESIPKLKSLHNSTKPVWAHENWSKMLLQFLREQKKRRGGNIRNSPITPNFARPSSAATVVKSSALKSPNRGWLRIILHAMAHCQAHHQVVPCCRCLKQLDVVTPLSCMSRRAAASR